MRWHGKRVLKILGFLIVATSVFAQKEIRLPTRQAAPGPVLTSAQQAVQKLSDEVVKGNMMMAFDSMNPEWKKRAAMTSGGVDNLEKAILGEFDRLKKQGTTLSWKKARPPLQAMEVDYGIEERGGKRVGVYRQWMVFVPTVSLVTAMDHTVSPPKMRKIKMKGFQVALQRKGMQKWTFIDGSRLKAADLRALFPFLPAEDKALGFPERRSAVVD